MSEFVRDLAGLLQAPPADAVPPTSPSSSYREVVSLQAIFVTLTIALLAYIQKEPVFQVRADALFALLAAVPLVGLFQIVRGRIKTPECDIYLCAQPVRAYARQALLLDLLLVGVVSYLYWRGQLPGQ